MPPIAIDGMGGICCCCCGWGVDDTVLAGVTTARLCADRFRNMISLFYATAALFRKVVRYCTLRWTDRLTDDG